jgi:hypothetical protein
MKKLRRKYSRKTTVAMISAATLAVAVTATAALRRRNVG